MSVFTICVIISILMMHVQHGKTYEDLKRELGQENVGVTSVKEVSSSSLGIFQLLQGFV